MKKARAMLQSLRDFLSLHLKPSLAVTRGLLRNRVGFMVLVSVLAGTSAISPVAAPGNFDPDDRLFGETANSGPLIREGPSVIRTRFVNIHLDLLGGARTSPQATERTPRDTLVLNLFPNLNLTAQLDRFGPTQYGFSWNGHIQGVPLSDVILVVVDGIVAGSISMPGAYYFIEYAGNGVHAVYQINQDALPPDGPAIIPPAPSVTAKSQSAIATPASDDGSIIDVMVVYTPAARSAAGGTSAIQAAIDLMVSTTNQAYTNSGITPRLNLVHTEEVSYTETGGTEDLDRLTNSSDGFMDNVHSLRNTYGADLVALITEPSSAQYCGIAWLMTSVSPSFESSGFSVTLRTCGGLVFAHEVGHNEGMHHDWYVNPVPGAYTYSHGHVHIAGASSWRTIMSYSDKCTANSVTCPRITHFSNPAIPYSGSATGVPIGTNLSCTQGNLSNPDCDADNRQTLNNTAFTVSNFRMSLYPASPSNLSTGVITVIQINLSWQDNSNNESGFVIERKLGISGTYAQIAIVGPNVISFPDLGVAPNTQYCYRVRSYNANGNSNPSNESCATTPTTSTSAVFRIDRTTGLVNTDGSFNCGLSGSSLPVGPCFNSGTGADLAERIEVSEPVAAGDVVELDPQKPKFYRKTRAPHSSGASGVISAQPGMTLNNSRQARPSISTEDQNSRILSPLRVRDFLLIKERSHLALSLTLRALIENNSREISIAHMLEHLPTDARPLLALVGRVYVKATTENGPIRPGDLLVSSSKLGFAMRCLAHCDNAVIGKALESLPQGEGLILILVMSR